MSHRLPILRAIENSANALAEGFLFSVTKLLNVNTRRNMADISKSVQTARQRRRPNQGALCKRRIPHTASGENPGKFG
jgi:hypothetical protein